MWNLNRRNRMEESWEMLESNHVSSISSLSNWCKFIVLQRSNANWRENVCESNSQSIFSGTMHGYLQVPLLLLINETPSFFYQCFIMLNINFMIGISMIYDLHRLSSISLEFLEIMTNDKINIMRRYDLPTFFSISWYWITPHENQCFKWWTLPPTFPMKCVDRYRLCDECLNGKMCKAVAFDA